MNDGTDFYSACSYVQQLMSMGIMYNWFLYNGIIVGIFGIIFLLLWPCTGKSGSDVKLHKIIFLSQHDLISVLHYISVDHLVEKCI